MSSKFRTVSIGVLLLAFTSCANKQSMKTDFSAKSCDYHDLLKSRTRTKEVYRDFSTRLYLSATLLDRLFCNCYVEEVSARKQLIGDDLKTLEKRYIEERDGYHDILIAVYTPERTYNDLADKESIWHLALAEDKEEKSPPVLIKHVLVNPEMRIMYPFLDRWKDVYLVRFKQSNLSFKEIRLFISGLTAQTELSWEIERVQ